jgi:replicative DNA helicase
MTAAAEFDRVDERAPAWGDDESPGPTHANGAVHAVPDDADVAIPPHALEVERVVLGNILYGGRAELPNLRPEHLYSEAHRRIYEACVALMERGRPMSLASVAAELRSSDRLQQVGGTDYLEDLVRSSAVVSEKHMAEHASLIVDAWRRRKVIAAAQRIAAEGYGGQDADTLIEGAVEKLAALGTDPSRPRMLSLAERARAMRSRGAVVRLATGLPTLDANCRGGLRVPRIVVIGGAPGAGKTALVVWLALTFARAGVPVVFLAVDEGADDITMRIALLEGLDVGKLEAGDGDEWDLLEERLAELPIELLDSDDGWTIETAGEQLAAKGKGAPGVLVVDSAQTANANGTTEAESLRARADAVLRALRSEVRSRPTLVLATSELAREAYKNRKAVDRINDLASFKESGSIEYAAETGIVLRSVPDGEGVVEAACPKNRGGKRDTFFLEIDDRTRVREVPDPTPDEATLSDKREEKRAAKEQAKDDAAGAKIDKDARKVVAYVLLHPGCTVTEARTNALNNNARRWAPAVARLGDAFVKTRGKGEGNRESCAIDLAKLRPEHQPNKAGAR